MDKINSIDYRNCSPFTFVQMQPNFVGGQRLFMTYLNANNERTTIEATVICLNGSYLRVCEVGDIDKVAKSIKLSKLLNAGKG